jgi:hypothetical protein
LQKLNKNFFASTKDLASLVFGLLVSMSQIGQKCTENVFVRVARYFLYQRYQIGENITMTTTLPNGHT